MQLNSKENQLKYYLLKIQLNRIKVKIKKITDRFFTLIRKKNKLLTHKKVQEMRGLKLKLRVIKNKSFHQNVNEIVININLLKKNQSRKTSHMQKDVVFQTIFF